MSPIGLDPRSTPLVPSRLPLRVLLLAGLAPLPGAVPSHALQGGFGSSGAHGALTVSLGVDWMIDLASLGSFDPERWVVRFDYTLPPGVFPSLPGFFLTHTYVLLDPNPVFAPRGVTLRLLP